MEGMMGWEGRKGAGRTGRGGRGNKHTRFKTCGAHGRKRRANYLMYLFRSSKASPFVSVDEVSVELTADSCDIFTFREITRPLRQKCNAHSPNKRNK